MTDFNELVAEQVATQVAEIKAEYETKRQALWSEKAALDVRSQKVVLAEANVKKQEVAFKEYATKIVEDIKTKEKASLKIIQEERQGVENSLQTLRHDREELLNERKNLDAFAGTLTVKDERITERLTQANQLKESLQKTKNDLDKREIDLNLKYENLAADELQQRQTLLALTTEQENVLITIENLKKEKQELEEQEDIVRQKIKALDEKLKQREQAISFREEAANTRMETVYQKELELKDKQQRLEDAQIRIRKGIPVDFDSF